jgi:hypothetical protein
MLNRIPQSMRNAARLVVIRHPNAVDCQVWRKRVTRVVGAEAGELGGLPTLGGMGVLDPEDEAQVDYDLLGDAKLLFAEPYTATKFNDQRDAAEARGETDALVESVTDGLFEVKDSDLVMVMPGAGVVVPYEVVNIVSTVDIPPYVPKVRLAAQGVMDFPPGMTT